MGDDIQARVSELVAELREKIREKALAEHEANLAKEDKGYYNCPSCGYELDTGWECGRCGADWQEEATRKPIPKDLWSKLHGTPPSDDGYDSLRAVYAMALEQAQGGKGKERHANGQPFDQQPICQGGRRFGPGCLIYQAWKKAHETPVLLQMDNGKERAIRELLGVINYAAAAILVIKEGGDAVE